MGGDEGDRVIRGLSSRSPYHPNNHHPRLTGDVSLYALDEPIHAKEFFVSHGLPLRNADLTALIRDGTGEDGVDRLVVALEAGGLFLDRGADIFGNEVGDRSHVDDAVLPATPVLLRFPGTVHDALDNVDVVGRPVPNGRGENGLRRERRHVGVVADAVETAILSRLLLGDHIRAAIEESLGCRPLLGRIEPGVRPDYLHGRFRISLAYAEGKGVDAADDLGDREGRDVADLVRLGHLAGKLTGDVAWLLYLAEAGADVFSRFKPGDMDERRVREILGDVDRWVHIAERRREDYIVAVLSELADHPLGVGWVLWDILLVTGLDVWERFFECKPRLIVRIGPAQISDWADIDEPNFNRLAGWCGVLRGGAETRAD